MTRLIVALVLSAFTCTANAYWIRPIFGSAGLFQDGLDINGATYDEQTFTDASRAAVSRVDLAYGEVGVSTRLGTPSLEIVNTTLASNALFGETITFNATAPEFWDFSLDIEGFVSTNVGDPFAQGQARANLKASVAVFEGNTAGTSPSDWASAENLATALFYEEIDMEFSGLGQVDEAVFESIYGSLQVAPFDSFDIVVRMWAWCGIDQVTPGYCDMDFINTATFLMDPEPSTFTSTSGEFLGSAQTVPVPAAVWLFASALGFAGWVRRRQLM